MPHPTSFVQRFLLEELDIRGAVVQLTDVWQSLQKDRLYPSAVSALFGEMVAVCALLTGNLKQAGRLTFQLSGQGPVSLMVVDCNHELNLRGYARCGHLSTSLTDLPSLVGDGRLMLTLDTPDMREPYRSFVPLEGAGLNAVFEHYLAQSEQQPAGLWLCANEQTAAGLFIQKLPGADMKDLDGWTRIQQLANTVRDEELRTLSPQALLTRLFHEEAVRLYDPRPITHRTAPDWDKVRTMLRQLGESEVREILAEKGEVIVSDELSNQHYRFSEADVDALFENGNPTLH